jgi:uncharacterized membrane protein
MILIFALLALSILLLAGYLIKKKRNPPGKRAGSREETQYLIESRLDTSNTISSETNSSVPISSVPISSVPISSVNISEPENPAVEAKMPVYAKPDEAVSIEPIPEINYEPPDPLFAKEDISETEMFVQQGIKLPVDPGISANPSSGEVPDLPSPEGSDSRESSLPDDLKEIMDLIRANGNRITQRELRKKSPYSESKVSLMLSDLEERGLIEKFKKGRGNVIRIPDSELIKQGGFLEKKE